MALQPEIRDNAKRNTANRNTANRSYSFGSIVGLGNPSVIKRAAPAMPARFISSSSTF